MKKYLILSIVICLSVAGNAFAAPTVTSVGGSFTHDSTQTITGSGFGSKSTPAPVMWDNAESGTLNSQAALITKGWTEVLPSALSGACAGYNTMYRQAGVTISNPTHTMVAVPHANSTRFIAGGHAPNIECNGCVSPYDDGANVGVSVPLNGEGSVYARWYERVDDNWPDNDASSGDNYKWFQIGQPAGSMNDPHFYLNNNNSTTPQHKLGYEAHRYRDYNIEDGCGWEAYPAGLDTKYRSTPVFQNWIVREVYAYNGLQSDGWIKAYVNNKVILEPIAVDTTPVTPAGNCAWASAENPLISELNGVSIGSYWRDAVCIAGNGLGTFPTNGIAEGNVNAWRYFDDIYIDTTFQRVMLCNNQTLLADGTDVCEPQIPSAWADGSITVTVNQGALSAGTNYLFVFDSDNAANGTGYPVTLGNSYGQNSVSIGAGSHSVTIGGGSHTLTVN